MSEYTSSYAGKRIDELLGMVDQNAFASADHTHESNNVILWEGAKIMNGGQTITLAEKVSEQSNGIVLVFSYYETPEGETEASAQDHSWSTHFVPKTMVELNNGGGQVFLMAYNSTLATFGAKYLKIYDDSISGYAANGYSAAEATSGISISNNFYVLRYVIGV